MANKNGEVLYIKNNLGIFSTKISPAKIKFKINKTDTHIYCNSEYVPDNNVYIKYGENDSVTFCESDGSKFKNYKCEWYGSAYIKTPVGEVIDISI